MLHSCIVILNILNCTVTQSLYLCGGSCWRVLDVILSRVIAMLTLLPVPKSFGMVYSRTVCLLGIFPSKSYRSHDSEASVLDLLIHCVLAHLSLPLDKIGASGNFGNFGGCHFCTVKFLMSGFVSN